MGSLDLVLPFQALIREHKVFQRASRTGWVLHLPKHIYETFQQMITLALFKTCILLYISQ